MEKSKVFSFSFCTAVIKYAFIGDRSTRKTNLIRILIFTHLASAVDIFAASKENFTLGFMLMFDVLLLVV